MDSSLLNIEENMEHSYAASSCSSTGGDLTHGEEQLFKCKECNKTFTKNMSIFQPALVEADDGDNNASTSREACLNDSTSSISADPCTLSEQSGASVLLGCDDVTNDKHLADYDHDSLAEAGVQPSCNGFCRHSNADFRNNASSRSAVNQAFSQSTGAAISLFSNKEMSFSKTLEDVEQLSDCVTLALECEEQDLLSDEEIHDEFQLEAKDGFSCSENAGTDQSSLTFCIKVGCSKKTRARHVYNGCDDSIEQKKNLFEHVGIHADNRSASSHFLYNCPSCSKCFSHRRYLDSHLREHACEQKTQHVNRLRRVDAGEKLHPCSSCGKAFARMHALAVHQKVHSEVKPHVCTLCDKTFLYRKSLDCHLTVHTGEKQHICSYCGKAYASKSNLVIHTRIHTGEKPFDCSSCGEAFPYKTALLDHVIRAHSGKDSYRCSFCDKGFRSKVTLVSHTRILTGERPYVCSLCHIAFKFKGNLVMHEKTHTGEKPFACSQCDKAFVRHSHLVRHTRIHTGEKPYACSDCDRAFTFREQLAIHCKRVHVGDDLCVTTESSPVLCLI